MNPFKTTNIPQSQANPCQMGITFDLCQTGISGLDSEKKDILKAILVTH